VTYELVIAVVPSDSSDPVERAYELMNPYLHSEECGEDDGQCHIGHIWANANAGGHYFMAGPPHQRYPTIAQFIAYEERLAAYQDHLAIPMECHT
jgi:hypothetical protein